MIFESASMAASVKRLKGLGGKFDAHHILPQSWAVVLGSSANGPAVLLKREVHQIYTTKLNSALRTLKNTPWAAAECRAPDAP